MAKKYILSIDQGTTGTTVMIFDHGSRIVSRDYREFDQIYPELGWVEHDPDQIWSSTLETIEGAMNKGKIRGDKIAAIGITNQRETYVVWDRRDQKPLYNAIVWQCRRTAAICEDLIKKGYEETFMDKTGLLLDPYFSGTKIKWLLENVDGIREKSNKGEVMGGTIDTFLLFRLTAGRCHFTDVTNASRTLLMNLQTLEWDEELLSILDIPTSILPEIRSSSEIYGTTKDLSILPDGVPIAGMAGDQQSALFGQLCINKGDAKCTYGTGSFLLINTGGKQIRSKNKILTTVAWKIGKEVCYALEGSVFIAGAAVQWLRDGLGIITSSKEVEELAMSTPDSGGVVFVPAFVGLGAPHWRAKARGIISGITRGTTSANIARAALEGIAFQNYDLARAMKEDSGISLNGLKVDGGASANDLLMQFQADILDVEIIRPKMIETTALGAAFMAGLAVGFWNNTSELLDSWLEDKRFHPSMDNRVREDHIKRWEKAVKRA